MNSSSLALATIDKNDNNNHHFFPIRIITKSEEFTLECRSNMKVRVLKWEIHRLKKIEPKHQRLFFEGIELEEIDYELSCYGIELPAKKNINGVEQQQIVPEFELLLMQFYQGIPQAYFLDQSHYDPKWNCSYEGVSNTRMHFRGGQPYFRPIGCVRYGIKVLGNYENDTWLGGKGYRTKDEWPVAYHGTKELNVLEILRNGYLIRKGVRFAYGKGIYCTPNPYVALKYADHYKYEGKLYKLIIQCRVNPKKLEIYGKHCWLVTDEKHIRPYAICVYANRDLELIKPIIRSDEGMQKKFLNKLESYWDNFMPIDKFIFLPFLTIWAISCVHIILITRV